MATPAAVLSILVEANTSAANANLAKTNAELDAAKVAGAGATSATSKTSSAMRKLGTAAKWGGAALAVGFVAAAKSSVATTNDLTKSTLLLTKNFGLSGKAASEWAGVARARGADATKLGMAFKTLASQISSAADGSDTSVKMFKALGFTQQDIQKSMKDSQFAIGKVAEGFQSLPPGMEKANLAGKLFGRGWQTIFPILRDGRAAMQDQLDTVEKYGGVLAGKTLKQQEDFLAAQRESKIAWQGMQVTLGTALTPALIQVNEQFQKIAAILANDKLSDDQKFQKIADLIQKDLGKVSDFVLDLMPKIANIVGREAPKVAGAFINGFLQADAWGKLAIAGFLITKLGGRGAFVAIGKKIGSWLGFSMATTVAAETKGAAMVGGESRWSTMGTRIGGWIGPAVAAAAVPILLIAYRKEITDFMHSKGFTLPTETVPSSHSSVNPDTSAGGMFKGFKDALGIGGSGSPTSEIAKRIQNLIDDFGTLKKAGNAMSDSVRVDFLKFAASSVRTGDINSKQFRHIRDALEQTGDASDKLDHKWDIVQGKIQRGASQTASRVTHEVQQQAQNVAGSYGNMANASAKGMDTLRDNTNKALAALGLDKAVQFRTNEAPIGAGGQGHRAGAQTGAVIVPGSGSGDKVPVGAMVEPGEALAVLNRNAAKAWTQWNERVPRFAAGGAVSGDTAGLVPPFLGALHSMSGATHTPINVMSGFRSRAEQAALYQRYLAGTGNLAAAPGTSHHELGIAADISPGRETFGGVAGRFGMGFTVPSESWHIELLNAAAGKMGAGPQKIARIILQGPAGATTSTGQAGLDKVWAADNRFIRQKWASAGQLNFTGGKFSLGQLAQLWIGAKGSRGIAPLMAHIAMAESGGDPMAHNASGATGLWQILGALVPGNLYDPHVNALNAVAKYRTQGLSAWAASQSSWGQYAQKGGMVMPPFGGSFGGGGIVPGPLGAPRTIVAHGGERVGTPNVNVSVEHNYAPGMEWLEGLIDSRVDVAFDEDQHHRDAISGMRSG